MSDKLNLPDDIVRGRRLRGTIEDTQDITFDAGQMRWLSFFLGTLLSVYAERGDSSERQDITHRAIVDLFRAILGDGTIPHEMTQEDHQRLGVIDMEIAPYQFEADGHAYADKIFEHCEQYWKLGWPKKARVISFVLPLD